MGKNKKNGSQKSKYSNTQAPKDGKVSQNGTEKKNPQQGQAQKSQSNVIAKNKSPVSERHKNKARVIETNISGSVKVLLVVTLLSISVAICGVVFRQQIQEVVENTFHIHLEVPELPLIFGSEDVSEKQEIITSDADTEESSRSSVPDSEDDQESSVSDIKDDETNLSGPESTLPLDKHDAEEDIDVIYEEDDSSRSKRELKTEESVESSRSSVPDSEDDREGSVSDIKDDEANLSGPEPTLPLDKRDAEKDTDVIDEKREVKTEESIVSSRKDDVVDKEPTVTEDIIISSDSNLKVASQNIEASESRPQTKNVKENEEASILKDEDVASQSIERSETRPQTKDEKETEKDEKVKENNTGDKIREDGLKDVDKKDLPSKSDTLEQRAYSKSNITNSEDFKIHKELDEADELLEKDNLEKAIRKYDEILRKHVSSPRAHYGKGLTLDKLGFKYMSNENLEQAIDFLARVLQLHDVPDELVKLAGRKLADRQQFRGWGGQAVKTFKTLNQRFPHDLTLKNELGMNYMMIGRDDRARDVFKEVLAKDATNGFAKAHLGFIVKTQDNDLEKAVELLSEGILSGEPGTADGRFYMQLGDSLLRLGRENEARKFFQEGADKGLFLSAWQRSLYNVDRLTGRPWWTPEQTPYQEHLKLLRDNWKVIRDEGLAQLNAKTGSFVTEDENLRDTGDWKQFTLYQQGRKKTENCVRAPRTCQLIDQIPDAKGCKRGQVKFSVMSPGIHVWPHVGPTNCRIRAHLGLVVPEGPVIRVMNSTRTWKEGEFIIFDDSFEHEVWHEGSELRLVLIVDFWHPELTDAEKRRLSAI